MNEVVHTSPTIGSNVEEIILRKTHFLMWDIGGQETLRSTWNTYYSNTEVMRTGAVACIETVGTVVDYAGCRDILSCSLPRLDWPFTLGFVDMLGKAGQL